ncbi:RWD domain-containing protein 3 isoform X3 [Clupea harengus]|uniref:RWD domain-containing protein 3 n=1 Tax=Clupea harengus TaxID=7950 RepID=A0A6P8G774_CLUHA|nr:RWD domain-containing protein 3 isoform X3 [Clupea harengus]
MSEVAADEMSVLSAIYCGKDEFELLEESADKGFVFRVKLLVEGIPLNIIFHLSPEYPRCLPVISVSSEDLSRHQCQSIKESLIKKAVELQPDPMVHELLSWFKENSSGFMTVATIAPTQKDEQGTWVALLHLDHMRAKTKYVKLIEKFTSELDLTGRLFLGRIILILLQGARENIKEYLHLQKTAKVDVDSSGKRCKEKMMRVLCETPLSDGLQQLRPYL